MHDEENRPLFTPTMNHQDVDPVAQDTMYDGYLHLKTIRYRFRRFDGQMTDVVDREVIQSRDVAVVLPYDPHADKIVLIEQCRAGVIVHDEPHSPWLLECVAGVKDTDESIDTVARRELHEEAGLSCSRLEKVMNYWVSPGISSEFVSLFCAHVDSGSAMPYAGLDYEDEDIATRCFDIPELENMLRSNHIVNGATIIALQWFLSNHAHIRNRWLDIT